MRFFSSDITVDQHGKAINFKMHSLKTPHMRALHLAWISFMVAFLAWYSIPPVIDQIAEDLNIPSVEVYDSNMAAVAITIVARLCIGPLCERWGPRRVMACLLVIGAIPCGLTGLLGNGTGLIILRCFIGILGGTFVCSQFWTTLFFAPSVVGTANAISAGWGNMGAGIAYLVIPACFNGIAKYTGESIAWRVVFVIPAGICILVAFIDYFCSIDTPHGDWLKLRRQDAQEKDTVSAMEAASDNTTSDMTAGPVAVDKKYPASSSSMNHDDVSISDVKRIQTAGGAFVGVFRVLINPTVLITVCFYACSFGTELAIDNVIGQVFRTNFHLDPSTASYIGSIFGLLNLFSRISGGLFSDFCAHRLSLPGRILAQLILMSIEGLALIGFSFGLDTSLGGAIALMVLFSFFVQAVCGSTFGIVPFIDPANNGKVMGIVGAGGNLGGLIFNLMFRQFQPNFHGAFLCLGCITTGVAVLGCTLISVQGRSIWHLSSKLNG
ncbi:MFS general substrate transporter [Lichtheimia hyalospora FSU 10163]|nr:MFS general substrate transporter [Lichtheimia hyalospora FSU 10163]